jgi:hypothetical protein
MEKFMKTMEELENELRAWEPRPPSRGLRNRIFGRPAAKPEPALGWGWNQARLAFASAVGLALVVAIHQGPAVIPGGAGNPAMLAAAISNQDLVAYVAPRANQEWNLPASAFDHTNGEPVVPASFTSQTRSNR